jgi:multicomponent K+:H+ antiporter subunit A
MMLALLILIIFAGAIIPPLAIHAGRNICTAATATITLAALSTLLSFAPDVVSGEIPVWKAEWVSRLGLSLSFFVDGLGFFFAALILGIGFLIIIYARFYLSHSNPFGRFFSFLLLFQGSMVGIVLSDNILLMIVFWELTSLTSFLLIGYWSHLPEARQGARMALIVTGGGGLSLIAGMLLLGQIAGSYELSEILQRGEQVRASRLYLPTLLLVLGGAFTKSAQFPFHFWLPHAMAAPTPVSAYLHSATMVKAGLFLMARLWPVLAGTDAWFLIVSMTGLVTMLMAAWIAIFKDDLKQLLAFSTVSTLGFVTMLLGMGTPAAAVAAIFHILNHATFKAALFMVAGVIDHEAGTRDIKRLGGLIGLMPVTATLGLIAAASSAGVPFLNGFLSKEMMLGEAAHTTYAGQPWLFPVLATLAALFSVAYSARLIFHVFLGKERRDYPHRPHDPAFGMWLPVGVLVVPVIAIGVLPAVFAGDIVELTAGAVVGAALPQFRPALWHGYTPALGMSAIALIGGTVLLSVYHSVNGFRLAWWRPEAKRLFESAVCATIVAARRFLDSTHTQSLPRYAVVIMLAMICLGALGFFNGTHAEGVREVLPASVTALVVWGVLLVACAIVIARRDDRLLTLILTSVVGLVVSLTFLQFSAPDLALTQISVEVVTTILLLLALNLLPKTTPADGSPALRLGHGVVAGIAGVGVAGLAYAVLTRGFETISSFHVEQSKPAGGGTNVVNVILVDFRGYDTLGEIIVLGVAGIAIFALLDSALRGEAVRRLDAMRPRIEAKDAHPLMLIVATRVLLPLVVTAGIFMLLRGHNLPGGGFIAGLVIAIAFIMQYIASGYMWAHSRMRFDAQVMIGGGLALAALTGVSGWVFGRPFLTSTYGHLPIPLIGELELASAMAFDLGVFFTVVGTVMLVLATIAQVEERAERSPLHPERDNPRVASAVARALLREPDA